LLETGGVAQDILEPAAGGAGEAIAVDGDDIIGGIASAGRQAGAGDDDLGLLGESGRAGKGQRQENVATHPDPFLSLSSRRWPRADGGFPSGRRALKLDWNLADFQIPAYHS
jgi:hypothetical protein